MVGGSLLDHGQLTSEDTTEESNSPSPTQHLSIFLQGWARPLEPPPFRAQPCAGVVMLTVWLNALFIYTLILRRENRTTLTSVLFCFVWRMILGSRHINFGRVSLLITQQAKDKRLSI